MEIPVEKNGKYIVEIIDYGANGEGIAKINGYTIFVIGALKGEKCKIHVMKILSSHAFAKVTEIIEASPERTDSDCETYPRCGGCSLRHINYNETLRIKKENVKNLIKKSIPGEETKVEDTIGMEEPRYYRNKAIYPISQNKEIGIFAKLSHNIVPIKECKIQTIQSQAIAKYIARNWNGTIYNEKTQTGLLRNIMIREGFDSKEIMVVLVQNGTENLRKDKINPKILNIEKMIEEFPNIKIVVVNINTKNTNVVLSNKNITIYGNGYIEDKLNEYTFKISPNSFYQVNPTQTKKIYNLAIEKAMLKENDILCDLYCGIGTIGIFASKHVKKVYGIEIVPEAIENAKENAKVNNINNIEFIRGDVEITFTKLLNKDVKPNVVIVDPPRKGLDNETVENLCKLGLERLIYISCNPSTLVRDLKQLKETYEIKSITPIDNFCYSSHVECVVAMSLKKNHETQLYCE